MRRIDVRHGSSTGRRLAGTAASLGIALALGGCLSLGQEFPVAKAGDLRIGETTQSEIQSTFGNPLMTGETDGNPSWTYTRVRYSLFGGADAEYLEVEFDEQGVLTSYSLNTTR
jgi:hypothetical protein